MPPALAFSFKATTSVHSATVMICPGAGVPEQLLENISCYVSVSGVDWLRIAWLSNHYSTDLNLNSPRACSLPCPDETLLLQLRLEVACSKHVLYKTHRVPSSACECGHSDEDVEHLLIHWTRFTTHPDMHRQRLQPLDRRAFSIYKTLGPWPTCALKKRAFRAVRNIFTNTDVIN